MLTCYLDDSYSDQTTMGAVGGYVSDDDNWTKFEALSELLLNEAGVGVFHTRDAMASDGPFAAWSEIRKQGLIDAWSRIAVDHVGLGVCRVIDRRKYDVKRGVLKQQDRPYRKHFAGKSWMYVCFATLLTGMKEDAALWSDVERQGLTFVIEAGNKHNNGLLEYVDSEREHGNLPATVTMMEAAKTSSRAIQLADLCATMCRHWLEDKYVKKLDIPERPLFLPMQLKVRHDIRYIDEAIISGRNVKTGRQIDLQQFFPEEPRR